MILHCEIQTGPLSPDWGHMPLSFPVTKILLWHNINIRDVTQQCSVILQIKAPSPSSLLDLSQALTGRVRYPFILLSLDQKRSVGRLGRWKNFYLIGQIHAETDKLTDYLQQYFIDFGGLLKLCVNTFNNYLRNRCKWQIRKIFRFDLSHIWGLGSFNLYRTFSK